MAKKADELLDQLRRRDFHVDCVRMELRRASDGKRFSGPGYIRQRPTRDFEIKMYAKGKINFRDIFGGFGSKKAGTLYGESDHFSLTAKDEFHRRWTATRIIEPSPGGHAERRGYLVTAECQEVALVERRSGKDEGNWIQLQSLESIKFPRTGDTEESLKVGKTYHMTSSRHDVGEFDSHGLSFCFDENDGLRVYMSNKGKRLHPQLEWRVTEAITFALGIHPEWSMISRGEGKQKVTRFRSHEKRGRKRRQRPPFQVDLDGTGLVWRMFDLFLGFVLRDRRSLTHPLARHVLGVVPRGSSAEGQALSTAVAVEAVLADFYSSTGTPDPKFVARVDELITHIKAWDGDKSVIARAIGSVGGLKGTRPDDRLRALVASGVVGEAEREAWKKLRNTVAHGDWDKYELQQLLDLTGKVVGLFNQLVFHLIGYKGKQTDYGTHSWPKVDYPPPKPTETVVSRETEGET